VMTTATTRNLGRLVILVMAIAVIGVPINNLFSYSLLVAAALVVFLGALSTAVARWIMAAAITAAVVAAHMFAPWPRIDEGFNVFLPGPDISRTSGLPQDVIQFMAHRFEEEYPPERRCVEMDRGCWRPDRTSAEDGFTFSVDGIFDSPAYSRRVTGIDFSDPVYLRLGPINERRYNWPDTMRSDVRRFVRDRFSFNLFDRFRVTFPVFIVYRFPSPYEGSTLCWRGDVLWEGKGEHFDILPQTGCRQLHSEDIGRRIFAISIRRDIRLAANLDASTSARVIHALEAGLTMFGVLGILWLLVDIRLRQLLLPLTLIGSALVVVTLVDYQFIGGFRPLDGADDGLVYEGFARSMLRRLLAGDIAGFLVGEEPVYYFTPGFRYFRVMERFIFGDTFLGYLSAILALPFLALALYRRFLPSLWAVVLVLVFVIVPIGALYGSSLLYYVQWAARGFADPFAAVLLVAGLVVVIPPLGEKGQGIAGLFGGVLLALAVFCRPNLVLAAGSMIAFATLAALYQRQFARAVELCLGFSLVGLAFLHNLVFGHVIVLFGTNVMLSNDGPAQWLLMTPLDYLRALTELLTLNFSGDYLHRAFVQIGEWLSGPSKLLALVPIHAVGVAVLCRIGLFGRSFDPWLRALALATLLQHGIGICYMNIERYNLVTWLLTQFVTVVWVREEGLLLLDRAWPGLRERIARRTWALAASRLLDRAKIVYSL
jgi:hypothetical protein